MARLGHLPRQLHTTAGIGHSFDAFSAATVRQAPATTLRKSTEPAIARRAIQDAYALRLAQWSQRHSRAPHDNASSVVALAAQTAADLGHRQRRSTTIPTLDRGEQPDGTGCAPDSFDVRDGFHELAARTDAPSSPMPGALASVLLIDNHRRWRQAVAARLIQLGVGTVYEAATLAGARRRALATGPRDLAILDLDLPDGSGIDLITELRRHGWPRIVVLASTADPDTALSALHAGAHAYLLKPASLPIATPDDTSHDLTCRQLQILQLAADGQSNKQIGHTLGLSALTVKSHLSRIGQKLGFSDRAQLVARAIRAGIIH